MQANMHKKIVMRWLTICLVWLSLFDCFTNGQDAVAKPRAIATSIEMANEDEHDHDHAAAAIRDNQEIESMQKYQQMKYQIQQQQQLQYQQQMQQQQQYHYLLQQQQEQQQQQQQQILQPMSLALQQKLPEPHNNGVDSLALPTAQTQLLKTGASLVVAAETGTLESGEQNLYGNMDAKQIASRRSSTVNGRKRKRRPQQTSASDANNASNVENDSKQYWRGHVDDNETSLANTAGVGAGNINDNKNNGGHLKARRRKQPAIREPLAALEKEQKLYELRDRQRQEHGGGATAANTKGRDKSYRRPYAQAKKENENVAPTATIAGNANVSSSGGSKSAIDLKNILKNSGGLSLSEILQQKNLSLDDLLKGKENALLALQTTAASPPNAGQNSENFKHLKPARRIPTTYLGGASSEVDNKSGERGSSEESASGRNKLKYPTLQRHKLFGTSSRATAIPLPGSGNGGESAAAKKREHTTTTAAPAISSTTRLPIYKKRAQQRPTLKPPSLFKFTTSAAVKETPSSTDSTTIYEMSAATTHLMEEEPADMQQKVSIKDLETPLEADIEADKDAAVETTVANASDMTTISTAAAATTTTPQPTTTTTASVKSTTAAYSTLNTVANSNGSRRHKLGTHATTTTRQRMKAKYRERHNDNNLKSNSIESNDAETRPILNSSNSRESDEMTSQTSNEDDDLENFFEEVSKEAKREAEEMGLAAESITARIDRTQNVRGSSVKSSTKRVAAASSTAKPTSAEDSFPDFDGIDDRTDLLELIEDRRSGNRLFKVLQQRNMTLDELIEHRKRGSSQLHLATIVDQNAASQFFPGQKVVLHDNVDIVTAFENFPHFNLLNLKSVKPDEIKTDSQGSSYFTSIIDIEPTDEAYKGVGVGGGGGSGDDGSLRGPIYSQTQSQRSDKSLSFFPSWKTLALASLTSTTKGNPFFLPPPKLLLDERNSNELNEENFMISNETSENSSQEQQQKSTSQKSQRNNDSKKMKNNNKSDIDDDDDAENTAEQIENEVARAHDLLDLELSGHAFKRSPAAASMIKQQHNGAGLYANMPAGIRSAIVASAAIVLTSMATFSVIFIVCRLKQRKRSNTNYLRSYSSIKSKTTKSGKETVAAATSTMATTSLGRLSVAASSLANSQRSSLRGNHSTSIENIIADNVVDNPSSIGSRSNCGSGCGGVGIGGQQHVNVSIISTTANQQQQQHLHPSLHRSNDLLFPRRESLISGSGSSSGGANKMGQQFHNVKTCTKGLLSGRSGSSRSSCGGDFSIHNGGFSSVTGSTSSLALSLRSAQNISSTKLNTMDPNSPEVQEYLFDTLRKSFN